MITACKAYITNSGSNSIWDQPQQVVADKIKSAIHLNQVRDGFFFCIQKLCIWNCNQCDVWVFSFIQSVSLLYYICLMLFVKSKKKKCHTVFMY